MDDNVLLIQQKGAICTLMLNRPDKNNSLSPDLLIKLHQTFEELSSSDDIWAVVISGAGEKAFSAGYDLTALPTNVSSKSGEALKKEHPLELAMSSLIHYPYPVFAMINGFAYGAACELAMSCDFRIAADDIRMGVPAAKLGLVYPLSGLNRFVQRFGFSRAKEILLSGRFYTAQQAKELGLVDYVVPRNQLKNYTYEMAEETAANAPLSLKGVKRILGMLADATSLSEEKIREADRITAKAFNSEDLKEGLTALMEKRKPVFKGR